MKNAELELHKKEETLTNICRTHNISVHRLAMLLDKSAADIICACQVVGDSGIRQQVAECLGAASWSELVQAKPQKIQAARGERLNMRQLVVLPEEKVTVHGRYKGGKLYEVDGVTYLQRYWCGKLIREQFFNKDYARGEWVCFLARA